MTLDLPSWAVVSTKRVEHIQRVVALIERWAAARKLDEHEASRWRRAAWYHDALKDAGRDVLNRYAPQGDWHPKLWHGPAAAAAAARHGETDQGVLDAIRYHSVGFADWDDAGKALYLADYLEPGREYDRAWRDEQAARVATDLAGALKTVAARRIAWLVEQGNPVRRDTWDFWNRIAADASSS